MCQSNNQIWVRLSSTVAAVATPLVDTDAVSGNAGIAGHRERDPHPALHEGLERCSGAPGRDPEPQLFQKHRAERAVKTGNGEDSAHREPNLDGLCITTTSML